MMSRMAMAKREPVTEGQLRGFKYFEKLMPLLDRLHGCAAARDRAGNRVLHYDQYIALQLLFFLNPVVTSMRGLAQASTLRKVREKLGVSSTSLGAFSEAGSVFDAELLKPIIGELGAQLRPLPGNQRLHDLPGILTAVDGTELAALAKLTGRAMEGRKIKLHTHFEPLAGVPVGMDLTVATGGEVGNLLQRLLPDRVYVMDRGYVCFPMFQAIIDVGSHFVCRVRDNSVYEPVKSLPLSESDRQAGILSDQMVWLGCERSRGDLRQPVRLIEIACKPHHKRGAGPEQGESLLIATSLDKTIQAELVGLIYRRRWTVELFFRFFKHILGCRHLMSHRANGIEIQVYVAIIVCMLIAIWTGQKPTLRTVEMIQLYFTDWASEDELEAHIAKLQKIKP